MTAKRVWTITSNEQEDGEYRFWIEFPNGVRYETDAREATDLRRECLENGCKATGTINIRPDGRKQIIDTLTA